MKQDDPWGVSWRIGNAMRRFSLRKMVRQTSAFISNVHYEKPVFIIGAQRSGTTTLFHLLRESEEFAALETEGHDLWRTFHHPRWSKWSSDALSASDALPFEARFSNAFLRAKATYHPLAARFVEKTPENSLRVGYLQALYPDAIFVVLKRNPGDVLNSLINGWRHPEGRYRSYFVPKQLCIPDYHYPHQWCFTLVPGWREMTAMTIPQIAREQWICTHQHLLVARELIAASNWVELHFEDMISPTMEILTELCGKIDIPLTPKLLERWKTILANPRNSTSAPGVEKWRLENEDEIAALLPGIRDLAAECGYKI